LPNIVIGRQFCGPPNSGNGGYVCGVIARGLDGPAKAVLRAPVPLDIELSLDDAEGAIQLTSAEGLLIGISAPGDASVLPQPPPAPGLEAARAASERYPGHRQPIHPICFTCGTDRIEGDGLRVFPGQLEGAPEGHLACVWTPDAAFADADGLTPSEIVWAALDCPGFFAWVVKEGRHGALLGTMTGEVTRRPRAGETTIVTAWPLVREGRKETAGVALFSEGGELLARAHQVWITMAQAFPAKAAEAGAATA
jgi:hypothetical protein